MEPTLWIENHQFARRQYRIIHLNKSFHIDIPRNLYYISTNHLYVYTYYIYIRVYIYMAVCQNLVPLVNIKIAGKWMFIPLKMVLIGIDP